MKVQTLNNTTKVFRFFAIASAVESVAAFAIYYFVAKHMQIKLNDLYFLSVTVNFSLLFLCFFNIFNNALSKSLFLGSCIFFTGVSFAYMIDWIGNDHPKMNNVYLCLIVSFGFSILYLFYLWIKSYFTRAQWNG